MPRATRRRSPRDVETERQDAPGEEPRQGVAEVLHLQRTAGNQAVVAALVARSSPLAGNRAVGQLLARTASGAPMVKDRKPIDDLANKQDVKPVERVRAYATIAGTEAVKMDPAVVYDSGLVKDGLNLVSLKQDNGVPAKTEFVDAAGRTSGGAPPEAATGVAILVNVTATRFQDEDYMVAAIRHEMVHARLMRLTLKHLADWKQKPEGLPFPQYVEKKVAGTDGALVKDRFFGGHMDETVAYAEGFLSAFFYAPIEAPGAGDRAWIAHFEGFTKEFQNARNNSGGVPKSRAGVQEQNLATRQSANAVIPETEKLVKEYCDAGGAARRKNLAAWMEHLNNAGTLYEPALAMVYKVATGGKSLPKRKP
jgi:hypothetical protein